MKRLILGSLFSIFLLQIGYFNSAMANESELKTGADIQGYLWHLLPELGSDKRGSWNFNQTLKGSGNLILVGAKGKSASFETDKPVNVMFSAKMEGIISFSSTHRLTLTQGDSSISYIYDYKCKGCQVNSNSIYIPKQHLGSNLHLGIVRNVLAGKTLRENVKSSRSCQKAGYCMACESGVANATGGVCAFKKYTYSNYCTGSQSFIGNEVEVTTNSTLVFYDDNRAVSHSINFPSEISTKMDSVRSLSNCEL